MALYIFKIGIQAKLSFDKEGKELLYIFQLTSEKQEIVWYNFYAWISDTSRKFNQ